MVQGFPINRSYTKAEADARFGTNSGTSVVEETPSGTIDGINVTFTLAHTPTAGTVRLFLNGARQQAGGGDYTISGATITFNSAPPTGSILLADYQY